MTETQITEEKIIEGLRGWLILVGLQLILACLASIYVLLEFFVNISSHDSWKAFSEAGYIIVSPFITVLILGSVALNMVFVFLCVYAGYLFFNKKKTFPMWFIGITLFHVVFFTADSLLSVYAFPSETETGMDYETIIDMVTNTISSIIFISYILVSKRVKATFVK
jgi:hypothetical protein